MFFRHRHSGNKWTRDQIVWPYHNHSSIWDSVSWRTHDHSWNAPGHHVAGRTRLAGWRQLWSRHWHRQRHRLSIIAAAAISVSTLITTGCGHSSQAVVSKSQPPSLDALYHDADKKSDIGE